MKKLDFNEMEVVNGGITCIETAGVIDYLSMTGHHEQVWNIFCTEFIGCYTISGDYVNYWDWRAQ